MTIVEVLFCVHEQKQLNERQKYSILFIDFAFLKKV